MHNLRKQKDCHGKSDQTIFDAQSGRSGRFETERIRRNQTRHAIDEIRDQNRHEKVSRRLHTQHIHSEQRHSVHSRGARRNDQLEQLHKQLLQEQQQQQQQVGQI